MLACRYVRGTVSPKCARTSSARVFDLQFDSPHAQEIVAERHLASLNHRCLCAHGSLTLLTMMFYLCRFFCWDASHVTLCNTTAAELRRDWSQNLVVVQMVLRKRLFGNVSHEMVFQGPTRFIGFLLHLNALLEQVALQKLNLGRGENSERGTTLLTCRSIMIIVTIRDLERLHFVWCSERLGEVCVRTKPFLWDTRGLKQTQRVQGSSCVVGSSRRSSEIRIPFR